MYRVIRHFIDLQDNNHKYDVGDTYPREGASALPSRVRELASKDNKLGVPLIEKIEVEVKEALADSEKKSKKKIDE